jgi:DNA polymerase phi
MGSKRKRQAQDATEAPPSKKQSNDKATKSAKAKPPPAPAAPPAPFVEDPRGPHLKREVSLYEQLSSEDPSERLQAADEIVSSLFSKDALVSEVTLLRHLERRLMRGLASGRKGARLGFSIVLTEILRQLFGEPALSQSSYTGLTFEKLLAILKDKTKPFGDLSGQEERDHAQGELFGLQCFIRAKVLLVEEQQQRWNAVFDTLVQLWKKKKWMREECGWVVVEALQQMSQSRVEKTLEKLASEGLLVSLEGAGICLAARRKFPDLKLPKGSFIGSSRATDNLQVLAKVLKDSSSGKDDENQQLEQKGSWNPQLHFVWNLVIEEYANEDAGNFTNFWKVAVDENLFSSSASPERKFWGFSVFQKALTVAENNKAVVDTIFSPNLMRCLINNISQEDRFLHRAAQKSLKVITQTVADKPKLLPAVVAGLVGTSGIYNFDQATKTKTVEKLLSSVSGKTGRKVFHAIYEPVRKNDKTATEKDAEVQRQIFGDYTLTLIRQINVSDSTIDVDWVKTDVLPVLASLGYSSDVEMQPPLSEKSRTLFRNRLSSALAHLISAPHLSTLPCELLRTLDPSAVDMDDEITAAKDRALKIMRKLEKKANRAEDKKTKPVHGLAMLYALVILQLYNGEPDAVSSLEELEVCYEKLVKKKDEKVVKKRGQTKSDEGSVVLIEVLLSFISKPSALLRKIAQHVFTAFSGEVTQESLQILLDVLDSKESLQGQQELFDQEDDEDEEDDGEGDDDDDDDDELDSDVEIIDVGEAGDDDAGSEEEDEEDDEDDDVSVIDVEEEDDDDDDNAELNELEEKLRAAVGTTEDADSDADMTDSEMMALDDKLVEIFSMRKKQPNKKQEKKDARENIVNFKTRVLDLLEIYVKEQAGNGLAMTILVPLLRLMRTTTAKHLSEKAHKIITTLAKKAKTAVPDVDLLEYMEDRVDYPLLDMMQEVHKEASKDPSHAFGRAASTASLILAARIEKVGDETLGVPDVLEVYKETQQDWLWGRKKLQAGFFHDFINWCQSRAEKA